MLSYIKNITFSFFLVLNFAFFLPGCSGESDNDELIKSLEESLERSTKSVNMSTTIIMKSLEEKTTEPATKERADIWFTKAKEIVQESSDIYTFIEKVKKGESVSQNEAEALLDSISKYRKIVLSTDEQIQLEFEKSIPIPANFPNASLTNNDKKKYSDFFRNSSTLQNSSILTKFQNDIKITENKLIAFCNAKVGTIGGWFFSYSAIVGQNSNYVKPGEEVKITAGVGAYSRSAAPEININGKKILLEDEGFAQYKVKASKNSGVYSIPVVIDFTDPNTGKIVTKQVNVKYTVASPCN